MHLTRQKQLKKIQERVERVLLKQQKKLKRLRRTLKQVEVGRICDQSVFVVYMYIVYALIKTGKKHKLFVTQEEARKTEDYCESTIVSIIDSLQRHFRSVKKFIGVQEKEAATQVQLSLKSLMAKKKRMKKRRDELKRLAQMDNDVSFSQVLSSDIKDNENQKTALPDLKR